MCSFYAFCRVVDDIVDDHQKSAGDKQREIDAWREEVRLCYEDQPRTPLGRELHQIIRDYLIPPTPLFDILDGVETDVLQTRYQTFEDLRLYCYRVASAVGLVSIEIFGYREVMAREYAVNLGLAFQLTNILRDVRYDLEEYSRVYLPQDELEKFGVREDALATESSSPERQRLFLYQYHRAEHYFHLASRQLPPEDRNGFIAAELMTEVYYRLLQKLKQRDFPQPAEPCRLTRIEKLKALRRGRRGASINRTRRGPMQVVVAGGGFAGMSAAIHLTRMGHQVELLESKSYAGGRAHSFQDAHTGVTLDNGQHIFMGCYHACMELIDLLGVRERLDLQEAIRVPFRSLNRTESVLDAGRWPFPLHMAGALTGYRELSLKDRFVMVLFALRLRLGEQARSEESAKAWLTRLGQTPNACRSLWDPFCIAALNEPTEQASAVLLETVLRQSLFGSPKDTSIYVSRVGLSDLLMPEVKYFLESTGSTYCLGEGVQSFSFSDRSLESLTTTKGRVLQPDAVVCALPWKATASLLPETEALARQIRKIESSPIVAIHLLTDRAIHHEPFVGLLDSPVHWIFDRSHQLNTQTHPGLFLYSIVTSAAYAMKSMKNQEIIDLVWDEILKHYPSMEGAIIRHSVVYKSSDATFAARPETEAWRPPAKTPWDNFILAGDWTDTGLPATLEGAALSGKIAASLLD
jgi:squalene-associated FAD-dependent desaturase